jgi:hypothetical protein
MRSQFCTGASCGFSGDAGAGICHRRGAKNYIWGVKARSRSRVRTFGVTHFGRRPPVINFV